MISVIQPNTQLPKMKKVKTLSALISQGATNPPTFTKILQNTLSTNTPVWGRDSAGQYFLTFDEDICNENLDNISVIATANIGTVLTEVTDVTEIYINTYNSTNNTKADGKLLNNLLEIKVYTDIE